MRVLMLVLLLAGCTPGYGIMPPPRYRVDALRDDFRGSVVHRMRDNTLPAPVSGVSGTGAGIVKLNAQVFRPEGVEPAYSLIVDITRAEWLFIRSGNSLNLLLDGERLALSGDGSSGHREIQGTLVKEMAWYDVTPDQLRRIATARRARLRIDGDSYFVERELSVANIENFAAFVAQFAPVGS